MLNQKKLEIAIRSGAYVLCMVGLAVVCCSCSSDDPVVPNPKMISDVGEHYQDLEYTDGTVGVYRYQEVRFEGDMFLAEYEKAIASAEAIFLDGEVTILVKNYRVFPESAITLDTPPDFSLKTCFDGDYFDCSSGRLLYANVVGGEVEVAYSGLIWIR